MLFSIDYVAVLQVKVQCSVCAMRQHAFCVRYDVTDPGRGAYKCPHCHAASVSHLLVSTGVWLLPLVNLTPDLPRLMCLVYSLGKFLLDTMPFITF